MNINTLQNATIDMAEFLKSNIKNSHNQEFLPLQQEHQENIWMNLCYQSFQILLTYIILRLLWGEESLEEIVWPFSTTRIQTKDARTRHAKSPVVKKRGHLIVKSIAYFTASIALYKIIPNYDSLFQWMDLDEEDGSEMY